MSAQQTVAITGASGFVGSALARRLLGDGIRVIALARRAADIPDGAEFAAYDLRAPIPKGALDNVDALIHCAYVRAEDDKHAYDVNIRAARTLIAAATAAGVQRMVFVSSLSAGAHARTEYGRQKHAIETLFLAAGQIVVRSGLVIGEGGLAGELRRHVGSGRWVPLIDGGRQPVYTIHSVELVAACVAALAVDGPAAFTIAYPGPLPFRDVIRAIAGNTATRFVPVPFNALRIAVTAASMLGIRLPVSHESLLAIRNLATCTIDTAELRASLERLGIDPRPL